MTKTESLLLELAIKDTYQKACIAERTLDQAKAAFQRDRSPGIQNVIDSLASCASLADRFQGQLMQTIAYLGRVVAEPETDD